MNNINTAIKIGFWLMLGLLGAVNAAQAESAAPQTNFNLTDLTQMVFAPDGSVWGTDTYNHRVLHLTVPDGGIIGQFGVNGKNPGQLSYPQFIALAVDGSVWVADGDLVTPLALIGKPYPVSYRLQRFKPDGTLTSYFGSPGLTLPLSTRQFAFIKEIKLAVDGSLWILDAGAYALQHYNANGSFIAQIRPITASAFIPAPGGSIWAVYDELWGADYLPTDSNWQVRHLTTEGTLIAAYPYQISQFSGGNTWITSPKQIEIAPDGSFWLAYSSALQHIKADGTLIAQLGNPPASTIPFGEIKNIMLSPDGSVWVRDTWSYYGNSNSISQININRLQNFNANGALLFASPAPSAEYIAQTATLTLRNIVIAGSSSPATYQATLHYQDKQFVLMDSGIAPPSQTHAIPAATFYPINNEGAQSVLDIPLVVVSGIPYKARLTNLGNYVFVLESLEPYY